MSKDKEVGMFCQYCIPLEILKLLLQLWINKRRTGRRLMDGQHVGTEEVREIFNRYYDKEVGDQFPHKELMALLPDSDKRKWKERFKIISDEY